MVWVAVQAVLLVVYAYTLIATPGQDWGVARWVGAPMVFAGAALATPALLAHGRKLTPLPEPNRTLGLKTTGIYAYIRHPMYTGLLLLTFGLAILLQKPWGFASTGVLTLFFNLKAREEERRLRRYYPEYIDYERTTGRFLPRWAK
ncbi:MAG: DUF1295 domain-containing protein [Fimbriimonadales bacterium]|nr:DUF1295 domain-containing protein [Fimbriimonadales bacterium]